MKSFLIVAVSLIATIESTSAYGQYYGGWGRGYRRGPGYRSYQRPARTWGASYAYGMADITRARSQANLTNAQALSTLSDVRSKEIRNRVDYTNMFFERRRINEEYRDSRRRPRATSEQLARFSADAMPTRASGAKIDSVTGEISWPFVLQGAEFQEFRQPLEELLKDRAETGSMLPRDSLLKARAACDDLFQLLRAQVRELPPNDFIEGRKFIDMLRYEARLAPT